ncbi:hypothetical protein T484DRAFT_2775440 [Baffinella frigidus]|nr:hypothetical protein T484DRAFT_2775440 [Cryptophyta sp. CCMP2293]
MPRRSCRNCMFLLVLLVSAWPNEGSTNECDKIVERAVDLGGQGDMAGGKGSSRAGVGAEPPADAAVGEPGEH